MKPGRLSGNNGNNNGQLSRAGSRQANTHLHSGSDISLLSLSLETWDEDEKDKRIRELEETLRKQKELMEILQKKLDDHPHPVDGDNLKYHALNSLQEEEDLQD